MLSDKALTAHCLFLGFIEEHILIPEQCDLSLAVFLQKPDGGRRPIGAPATCIRILGRLRREQANHCLLYTSPSPRDRSLS
eukprot:4900818-Pyramimonas_sp.AAC.1